MGKLSNVLSGVSGEHFVAAELSRRCYIASLTSKNTKGIDILASNMDASKMVGIQVKTNQKSNRSWMLSEPCEAYFSDNLFYVFVLLNKHSSPEYHVVPSTVVAKDIKENHEKWLVTPGKKGNTHNDTPIRRFSDYENIFLDRWDILGLE